MLIHMSEEEKLIWIKRKQIVFLLKRQNRYKSSHLIDKIEDSVFDMSDDEVEEKFNFYEDKINKETWVDCYPMFFHISEFEEALKSQLEFIQKAIQDEKVKKNTRVEWVQQVENAIKELYARVNKSNLNELTLEEKEELFWITHPITY